MTDTELANYTKAVSELADGGTPRPEDWMKRYSPLACLWYLRETSLATVKKWVAELSVPGSAEVDEDGILQQVTLGIGKVTALLTRCCVEMEMLVAPEGEGEPDGMLTDEP